VNPGLPIAILRAMAIGAHQHHIVIVHGVTVAILKGIHVLGVMAVETLVVAPVLQLSVVVTGLPFLDILDRFARLVALGALGAVVSSE
jgi:hypothetical protein